MMKPGPIRVLFISHTYVVAGAYQEKLELLARTGELQIGLLVPVSWKSRVWGKTFQLEKWSEQAKIYTAPIFFNGREGAYFFEPFSAMRAIADFRPDIIQVEQEVFAMSTFQAALFCLGLRKPLVVFGWENVDPSLNILRRFTRRVVLSSASTIISGNEENRLLISRWGYGGLASVLPQLGVDTRLFFPRHVVKTRPQETIIFIGRLVYEKGVDILLDAIVALKLRGITFHLVVCGTGPAEADLRNAAHRLGINHNVTWRGYLAHTDLPAVLQNVDALVLPSRSTPRWREQFGHVLIEAMAMGLPVIGSSCGEIPNVIGRDDLTFEEEDVMGLAEILARLTQDEVWRLEIRDYCLHRVREYYTNERIAAQLLEIYRINLSTPGDRNYQPIAACRDSVSHASSPASRP